MIFCLTGTNPYPFERLVKHVDTVLGKQYEVLIQTGNTPYQPKFSNYFNFCNNQEIQDHIRNADLIICQGGYGSLMEGLQNQKKVIAVPRLVELNEALDEQKELVNYFEDKKYILGCYDINSLQELTLKCLNNEFEPASFQAESTIKISDIIENFLIK